MHALARLVDVGCQDAIINRSLTPPTQVAMRFEHLPDSAPSVLYLDDLGTTLGRSASVSVSSDATSLPCMLSANLMTTVQFFELSIVVGSLIAS